MGGSGRCPKHACVVAHRRACWFGGVRTTTTTTPYAPSLPPPSRPEAGSAGEDGPPPQQRAACVRTTATSAPCALPSPCLVPNSHPRTANTRSREAFLEDLRLQASLAKRLGKSKKVPYTAARRVCGGGSGARACGAPRRGGCGVVREARDGRALGRCTCTPSSSLRWPLQTHGVLRCRHRSVRDQ